MKKDENLKNVKTFNELLDKKYGKQGSDQRTQFEIESNNFMVGELLKIERKKAKLTQEEIAEKIGTKKSYISRIERGKSDIQLSTLFKIFEKGIGKRLTFRVS